jgi:hypothetical protein
MKVPLPPHMTNNRSTEYKHPFEAEADQIVQCLLLAGVSEAGSELLKWCLDKDFLLSQPKPKNKYRRGNFTEDARL